MTDAEAAKLAQPPVGVDAAYRLADFYGICLGDGRGLETWLRVAAGQGDTKAMYSLAAIIEHQPGRAAEAADWQRKADEATRRQAAPPSWVSANLPLLRRLGIDPNTDLVESGNYHWSWTSRREVVAGDFRCPIGSSVDVSRSVVVMRAPESQACRAGGREAARMLKVLADGSAEPLGGAEVSSATDDRKSVEFPCPTPMPGYVCNLTQLTPKGGVH